jgi:hypothetical protein
LSRGAEGGESQGEVEVLAGRAGAQIDSGQFADAVEAVVEGRAVQVQVQGGGCRVGVAAEVEEGPGGDQQVRVLVVGAGSATHRRVGPGG